MNNYVFLYRTKAADDRDCCAYIDIDDLKAVHTCIDGKFNVHGACYSCSLGSDYANYTYDEVDTILTENQYNRLDEEIKHLIKHLTGGCNGCGHHHGEGCESCGDGCGHNEEGCGCGHCH